MLSSSQKDYLYQIIVAAIGEDISIKSYKSKFNEETVSVVEKMIAGNRQCNTAMKELFKDLVGASSMMTRGWLKKVLKASKKVISKTEMKGYGCMVVSKSKWKSAIIITAI
jgi:hypothetical protein